jgi:hypothetical protein
MTVQLRISLTSILRKEPAVKHARSQDSSNTYTPAESEPEKSNTTIKKCSPIIFASANGTFFYNTELPISQVVPVVGLLLPVTLSQMKIPI